MGMIRVYVAGAYNAPNVIGVLDNMRRGMKLAFDVLKAGFAPFCPFFDYHFSLIGDVTIEEYYQYSMSWLRVSDAMILVPGWGKSEGTHKELTEASKLGIPAFYTLDELKAWAETRSTECA